jgi:sulfur carrier protein ThiS
MNNKGFSGFILTLLMLALMLSFTIQLNENKRTIKETINELIKAEIGNKERTIIENNLDKIIQIKLDEQINLQNFNTQTAKKIINQEIYNYLKNKTVIQKINGSKTPLTQIFLNQNSSVQLLKSNYLIYAQYVYATNNTTTKIKQQIGENIITEFVLPKDYSKTIMRVI